jgi:hypothetical protein
MSVPENEKEKNNNKKTEHISGNIENSQVIDDTKKE